MEYENLKILKLEAENVKRLKVVEIVPQGNVVAIGGLNGQGKSSVLDSILYALAGARSMPDEPLRRGAKTGHIRLDLGDLIVERFLNPHGSSLEIRTRDGYRADSPQALLDTLVSNYTYDPLEFTRLKAQEQVAVLQRVSGLDFTDLDAERAQV